MSGRHWFGTNTVRITPEDRMRKVHLLIALVLWLGICLPAAAQKKSTTVQGKLNRVVAVGGESTGWAIQFDSETTIGAKKLHSIEIDYSPAKKLLALENKRVEATGELTIVEGVETGNRTVLKVSSIEEITAH